MTSNNIYEFDKGARLRVVRAYLGLNLEAMAAQLGVQLRSYQRWESGQEGIPTGVWTDVDALLDTFDDYIDALLDREDARVPVPRKNEHLIRAMSIALRERPELEPYYDDVA